MYVHDLAKVLKYPFPPETMSSFSKSVSLCFVSMFMYKLLHLKGIAHKDLLCSTWNSAQCYVPA